MDSVMRSSSLLAHIVAQFTSSQKENVATEALAYLLRRPTASGAVSVALAGFGVELPTIVSWRTQAGSVDDAVIPDLVGDDSQARSALIVEVKFGAGLTSNQPGAYLDRQDREFADDQDSPHLLVFLVPTRRVELLAAELSGLKGLSRRAECPLPLFERGGRPRVGVLGWGRMLAALEGELEAAGDEAGLHDLDQLRGLSNRADDEEMMPLSTEELSPERGRRQYEFHQVVHKVEQRLIATTPLASSSSRTRVADSVYGRYLDAGKGRELRVDVRVKDWGWEYPTPFWVRVRPLDADMKAGVRALHADRVTPHFREESWGAYLALDTPTGLSLDALVAHLADQCWTIANRLFPDLEGDDTSKDGHVV